MVVHNVSPTGVMVNILFLQSSGLDWLRLATSQMHRPVLYMVKTPE